MAGQDTAVGAILEIPPSALQDIQKAEKYIESLGKTSERVANEVNKHWGTIAPEGLQKFIDKIAQVKEAMGGLNGARIELNINTNQATQNVSNASKQIEKDMQAISATAQTIAQSFDFSNVEASVKNLMNTFGQVESTIRNTATARKQFATDDPEVDRYNRLIEVLKEYIAQKKKSQESVAVQNRQQAESDLNRLYTERLRLLKEKEQLENKDLVATAKGQAITLTAKENQLLAEVTARIQQIDGQIKSIGGTYAGLAAKTKHAFALDELRQSVTLQNKFNKEMDALDANKMKNLVAEYKSLYAENQRLFESMRKYHNEAKGTPYSATTGTRQVDDAYRKIEERHMEVLRQMRDLESKNIQEIADFRRQKEMESNQRSISEFIQAEAQKTAEAKKQAEQQSNDRIQAYQRFLNTYQGAMAAANRLGTRGGWEDTYENRARVIKNLEAAIRGLNKADSDYERKLNNLVTALNNLKNKQTEVNNAMTSQPKPNVADAQWLANVARGTKTLEDYKRAYEVLREVMTRTPVDSAAFKVLSNDAQEMKKRIDEVKKSMGEFKAQTVQLSGIVGQLRNQILAAFSIGAINGFIKKMVETRAQFELQRVALGAILQDSQRANQVFVEVQQMALQSPFSIMQLERATKQIAAFGFEADKLKPTLKMLADMSAGLGVEIDRLVLVMGHLKARGFLEGTMVRQFTNAGFNILGGLADYYSELEGKMVSVGEVQDRVKKKMVAFGDVEEVLKRVTSAGGMFYDMQKKQADSIWGQMQRITDAYDLMLNEIGQNNQTAISAALTSIRFLISNWKSLVNVVMGAVAAYGWYHASILKNIIATNGLAASQNILAKAFLASISAMKKMYAFILANPYTLLVAGIVAATGAVLDLRKKVDAAHESYANIIMGLGERQKKLNDIVDKITANNDKIKATNDAVDNATKGTFEYNSAVSDNKEALSEQYRVLQELRTAFPEVYNNIVKTKDGTVDLTRALEEFNRVSKMVTILTTLTDEDTHWYNEDFKTDMADLSKSQEKYNAQLAKAEAYFNSYTAKAEALYNTRKAEGDLSEKDEEKFKRILALRDSELTIEEKIQEAIRNGYRFKDNWISDLKENIVKLDNAFQPIKSTGKNKGVLFKDLTSDIAEAEREVNAMVQRVLVAAGVTNIEEFQKLPDETKKAAEQASQQMIKESGIALDEIQKDILHRNWEIPLQMKIVPESVEPGLSYLQEKINEYIEQHPEVNMPKIKAEEGTDNYFKKLKNNRKDDIEDQKQYNAAVVQLDEDRTNAEAVIALKEQENARKAMMDYFGIIDETKKKSTKSSDLELKRWQDLKKAIEDVSTAYDKYRKSFTVEESNKRIEQLFGQTFKELGSDIKQFYKDGKYDAESMIKALEVLKGMTKATTEERKKFRSEIERKIGTTQVEVEVKMKEDAEKKLKASLDEMFANYELSEELKKLGVSVDLTYMVGGRPTTIADIRKEIARLKAEGGDKEDAENRIKILEEAEKKIIQIEEKNQKARLKNYIKYLTESMGERAQIEIKALQDVNKIREDETLDSFSKEQAIMQRRKKMYEDLSKMDLGNLKSSDVYLSVFKDLERASKEQLQYVLNKLRELQTTFKDLSPAQVKSIANEMKKIEDALASKDSVKNLGRNLKDAIEYARQRNDLLREQTSIQETINTREKSLASAQSYLYDLQLKLKGIQDESSDEWKEANNKVQEQQAFIKQLQDDIEQLQENLDGVTEKINKGTQAWLSFQKGMANVAQYIDSTKQAIADVFEGIGAMFNIDDATRDAFESVSEILGGISKTANGLAEIDLTRPFTLITGLGKAIGGVFSTIGGFFGIGDKKKERDIQKLTEKVETLDKAYQRLEKSIEKAYTFSDYKAGYSQMQKTLEAEKSAYEEMIALEKAKKKTDKDKVKQYEDALEEIAEKQKDLQKSLIEDFGSTTDYRSAAEDFVSAWLDAFKETGDGLDALDEHWQDFIQNLFIKQAAMAKAGDVYKDVIDIINNAMTKGKTDFDLKDAIAQAQEAANKGNEYMNDYLKALAEAFNIRPNATGELILSDLQKGISTITEPQAAALEAYANSIRFAVFRHTEQLDTLIATIQMQYESGAENPVVTELKGIRGVLDNIYSTLRSVVSTKMGNTGIVIARN